MIDQRTQISVSGVVSLAQAPQSVMDVRFVKGTLNTAADALPHMCLSEIRNSARNFFFAALEAALVDNELTTFPSITQPLQLRDVPVPDYVTLTCEVSTGHSRLYVPTSMRYAAFCSIYNLSHLKVRATQRFVTSRYV